MTNQATAKTRIQLMAKSKWSWLTTLVLIVIALFIAFKINAVIVSLKYSLTPPDLPEYQQAQTIPESWPEKGSAWFYQVSQGTATLPVPYEWLISLEAPKSNPWLIFFGEEKPFMGEYILRHGFIASNKSLQNPDALPVGIAKTDSIYFKGIDRKASAAGFTCAACHTGQLIYDDKRIIIDGGPAMTDLGLLTRSLGAALGQTALSSKLVVINGRFERFAQKVLGSNYNVLTRNNLKDELNATLAQLVKTVDTINVTEGFTRLDALNRIGNQVFSSAMEHPGNYAPIDAPVNYPHIWTTSWFDWVQYDGSIMQPLIRNAGEALGVEAYVDTTGPDEQRFASSINYQHLVEIEHWLAGTDPTVEQRFNGLQAPVWPDFMPAVNQNLAAQGKELYQSLCQGCHLPPIDSAEFWQDDYWETIKYGEQGLSKQTPAKYLRLKILPLEQIGTDPAQARVLTNRTVDTTGLNLNTDVCTPLAYPQSEKGQTGLQFVPLEDSATANYGLALGAFVNRTNQQWFKQNYVESKSKQAQLEGSRPNCLQVGKGYKARPLNGIWATAPFLHNGSIASIYDLLSTQEERPTFIQLGNQRFDPVHVGIVQPEKVKSYNQKFTEALKNNAEESYSVTPDYMDSLFLLDTREPGNNNTGHLFDDDQSLRGRVGRKLSEDEKMALIEYLKTL